MFNIFVLISGLAAISFARPNQEIGPQNVVTVPPNCPSGQQWINGQCRDVWPTDVVVNPSNVVTVPPNCPPGQQWINGQCRDVWPFDAVLPSNVVTVPPNCPAGQEYINGQCRDIWRLPNDPGLNSVYKDETQIDIKNVVTVPPNCRPGQILVNGQCRDIWRSILNPPNAITLPHNCQMGQEYTDGTCRDVGMRNSLLIAKLLAKLLSESEILRKIPMDIATVDSAQNDNENNRNIISVPNQCPAGFKPDALGICREIFD